MVRFLNARYSLYGIHSALRCYREYRPLSKQTCEGKAHFLSLLLMGNESMRHSHLECSVKGFALFLNGGSSSLVVANKKSKWDECKNEINKWIQKLQIY